MFIQNASTAWRCFCQSAQFCDLWPSLILLHLNTINTGCARICHVCLRCFGRQLSRFVTYTLNYLPSVLYFFLPSSTPYPRCPPCWRPSCPWWTTGAIRDNFREEGRKLIIEVRLVLSPLSWLLLPPQCYRSARWWKTMLRGLKQLQVNTQHWGGGMHSELSPEWVNLSKRGGKDRFFWGLAGLLLGTCCGQSSREILRSSTASPRKTPSYATLLHRFTF